MAKKGKLGLEAALRQELERRAGALKPFELEKFCFGKQLAFVKDPARFKVALCSTRAGKTVGIAADLIYTCQKNNGIICLYVTHTARSARSIIWGDLKRIVQDYNLDVKTDETRLTIYFNQTRSEIRLGGAKDEAEIEKYRGWKLKKAYVDEAQMFRPYLKYFLNDILTVRLRDLRGQLIVAGTPGPICAGTFYDITHNDKWSQHHWTAFDNPHMLELEKTLAEEREIKGITVDDPGYIRETYGKWVEDLNSLVFKFNKERNVFKTLPEGKLEYIFGVDIGFNDADAIAVLGYSYSTKNVYLVEEIIRDKQDITSLVSQIKLLQEKYKPVRMVMDAGALGKKIQEEILNRHGLYLEAADKNRKFEFIELLNDDLRTGKLQAYVGSRFEEDCALVQWDRSAKLVQQQKLKISEAYHSDINDAVLYAWRECRHYLAEAELKKPARNTNEYEEQAERELAAREQQRAEAQANGDYTQDELDFIVGE